jgi:hypothetical protein
MSIEWENDFGKALSKAASEDKLLMLDFFNPG